MIHSSIYSTVVVHMLQWEVVGVQWEARLTTFLPLRYLRVSKKINMHLNIYDCNRHRTGKPALFWGNGSERVSLRKEHLILKDGRELILGKVRIEAGQRSR